MAGAGWTIVHEGGRLFRKTKAAALKVAQAIADASGRDVVVMEEEAAAKRSYRRNPDPSAYLDAAIPQMRARQAAAKVQKARGERRRAFMFGGPKPAAKAAPKAAAGRARAADRQPWKVLARKAGKIVSVLAFTKREANDVADAYEANGWSASIVANNPRKRAARRR